MTEPAGLSGSSQTAGIAALVTFGIPVRDVDELVQVLHGTAAEPARWFVFEYDLYLLGALDKSWGDALEMVVCAMPATDADIVAAALSILAHEGAPLERCVWLHGAGTESIAPTTVGLAMTWAAGAPLDARGVADRLRVWLEAPRQRESPAGNDDASAGA